MTSIFDKPVSFTKAILRNMRVPDPVARRREAICAKCPYRRVDGKGITFCGICKCKVSSQGNQLRNLATHVENLPFWGCKHPRRRQGEGWPMTIRMFWSCVDEVNFGDWVGPKLFGLMGVAVDWVNPGFDNKWVTCGSILKHAKPGDTVWGTGIMDTNERIQPGLNILALRGAKSRERAGVDCALGDPTLLLPYFYNPEIEVVHEVGVLPHMIDVVETDLPIGQIAGDFFATIDFVKSCKTILTSSLHGLVLAHAYGKRAVLYESSAPLMGDGVKFQDYMGDLYYPPIKSRDFETLAEGATTSKPEYDDFALFEALKKGLPQIKDLSFPTLTVTKKEPWMLKSDKKPKPISTDLPERIFGHTHKMLDGGTLRILTTKPAVQKFLRERGWLKVSTYDWRHPDVRG